MIFNFASSAEELMMKFDKKLESNRNNINNQIATLFDFLGDRLPNEQRKQLEQIIDDIICDSNKSQSTLNTQALHKIVRVLNEVINE